MTALALPSSAFVLMYRQSITTLKMRLEDAPGRFQKRWSTMLAPYSKDFPPTTDVPSPSDSDKSTGTSEQQLRLIIDESLLKFRMSPKAIGLAKIVRPALHAICDSIKRDPFVEDHVAEAVLQKQIRMYQDDLTFLGFLWEWLVRIFLLSSWIVAQRWRWPSFENFKSEAPSNELSARLLSRCAEFLQELSIYFLEMYSTNNVISYIHLAVNISQLAANITPDNHFRKGAYLNQLAKALHTRFQRLENTSDIECAVAIQRTAVDLTPENHPSKATYLNNLGAFVHNRFNSSGNLADIEDDIAVTRRALELTPDGHKSKPVYLRSLGISLDARYRRIRNLSDIDDAIASHRKATALIPVSDSTRAAYFHCLAISLKNRFDHPVGRPQRTFVDIEDAVAAIRVAVAVTSDEKPEKRIYLVCLGDYLRTRYEERMWPKAKDLIDLKDSIVVFRQALDLTPDSHPARPAYLAKLGIALHRHFVRTKAEFSAEIEDSIATLRSAITLSSDDDPGKSIRLRHLGLSLETRLLYQQVKSIRDLEEAFNVYMQAATQEVASPAARLLAAKWCAGLCWRYYVRLSTQDMLFQSYRCALPLIPQVAGLGHSISHRYEELANLGDVANSAAAIAIAAGQFELAVEWLEAGRGVVWGQIMRLRTRTGELHSQHPELGERLQAASRALSTVDSEDFVQYTVHGGLRLAPSEETSSKRAIAQEYQRILTEIRSKAGFERFLLPRTFAELAPPPGTGFIVVVNAHERRCDALIISASRLVHVPLPSLSFELAEQMHINLLFSLSHSGVRGRAFKQPTRKAMTDDDKLMRRVLERLWTLIVEPILQVVDTEFSDVLPAEGLPHVTWCATGPLAFLPFHAAGIYSGLGRTSVSRPRNAFDRVVSSYTPTLSALARQFGYSSSNQPQTPANVLVISQPETPGFDPIPNTVDEAQKVIKHFPPDRVIHLSGDTATVDTALQVLDENRPQIVHLACHGVQDISQPTNSAFMMHNGPLHLSSLMAKAIDGADLAFLSACQSATGHDRLSEESVHLAAGMLAVGYRAVIGTMWSIGEGDAPLVADEFYTRLRSSRDEMATEVAYALHGAVAKLREKVGEDNFIRWVPFVHFGR